MHVWIQEHVIFFVGVVLVVESLTETWGVYKDRIWLLVSVTRFLLQTVFHSHDHMQTELVFSVCSFFLTPQSENSKQKHFVRKFPINFQLMTNSNSRLSDQLFNWPIPDLLTAWMPSIVYILRFVWHYNEEKGMKNVAEEKSLPKRRRVLRH